VSINEISAEQFARLFHRYHSALAPEFGAASDSYSGRWQDISEAERVRLIAAARLTLLELEVCPQKESTEEDDRRRWFAKPGEAEWGC
jgi:hypothetical protein